MHDAVIRLGITTRKTEDIDRSEGTPDAEVDVKSPPPSSMGVLGEGTANPIFCQWSQPVIEEGMRTQDPEQFLNPKLITIQ